MRSFSVMTEQFYNLIVVMVIGVYTCDKTSKKCIHLCTHTHTHIHKCLLKLMAYQH